VVVDEEWPLMAQGEFSPKAWATIDEIRDSIQSFDSSTDDQLLLDQHALERVHGLADARRDRLLASEEGLPAIMWVVLIGGGFIVVGFTYLFGMENNLTHILMVAALALIISSVLFTVASLNYPFRGDVHIGPGLRADTLEVQDQRAQRPLTAGFLRPALRERHRADRSYKPHGYSSVA
jgi:hypothetical protein